MARKKSVRAVKMADAMQDVQTQISDLDISAPDDATATAIDATATATATAIDADAIEMDLDAPDFDELVYLKAFPDIADAVARGMVASGRAHFTLAGKAEGRLDNTRYRAELRRLQGGGATGAMAFAKQLPPPCSIDTVLYAPSGAVFIVGWADDRNCPITEMRLYCGAAAPMSWTRLSRLRREDAEIALDTRVSYNFGICAFGEIAANGDARPVLRPDMLIMMQFADGTIGELPVTAAPVSDAELFETAMSYLCGGDSFGNPLMRMFQNLDTGMGDALIAFNRRISGGFKKTATLQRFGPVSGRPKATVIVPIYGKKEFYFLQGSAFSRSPAIEDYEFIYVLNSPELIEPMHREARICQSIYGLRHSIVALNGNAGFSAANNVAAQFASSDRLVFVNPDVFPRDPLWAVRHQDIVRTHPAAQTNLFGATLYYDDGSLMHGGMYFEQDAIFATTADSVQTRQVMRVEHYGKGAPMWAAQFTQPRAVPAVTGAFMSASRAWFEKLGGFTEDYIFGHYEDADLCLKSLRAGCPSWIHDVRMWHLEGKGSTRRAAH